MTAAKAKLKQADLQDVLTSAVTATGLPGAAVAVWANGELIEAAAGVINNVTNVETTTDTLFQIGSITKVYTATLIMQLVDAGKVDLDAPAVRYVPTFRVADEQATATITVRQLLTHTAGFDGGDWLFEAGRGDDAVALYVDSLAGLRQLAPQGRYWSYNNAGYGVLGRIIELATGQVWDDAVRDMLLGPAGLDHTVSHAEDALLFRTAAGHQVGPDGKITRVKRWGMDRSATPFGLLCATPADVVGFARVHLEDGRGILSPASVKAMQEPHVAYTGEDDAQMGLGWMLRDCDGVRTIGHNGGTVGQAAFLTLTPEKDFACSLLTNGPTGALVWMQVLEHVTSTLGMPSQKPVQPTLPDEPPAVDLKKYVGRYERNAVHQVFEIEGDRLKMTVEYVDVPYDLTPPPPMPLAPLDAERFAIIGPDGAPAGVVMFLEFDDGRPQLSFLGRLARRV